MAKTKISEFSSTPANNTDIDSINIAEGCAPSNINDAIRELMAQLKDFQTGAVGDSFNGPIGSSTASTGAFTNITASGTLGVTGVATLGAGAILNTPASVTLTNATGLPISTGVSGLGTGVATALAVNVGSAGAPVVNGGALGTPSSGTVTNLTGTASININGTVGATTPTTGAFTTLSASSSVTLSGGTANGVTYLNGSKVLTSGSALTFDGTVFGVAGNTAAHTTYLTITNNNTSGYGPKLDFNIGFAGGYTSAELQAGATGTSGGYLNIYAKADGGALRQAQFIGDTYTGWNVTGSEQMRLTSTGLGIGTSSPLEKLDVSGTINASVSMVVTKPGSDTIGGGPYYYLRDAVSPSSAWVTQLGASGTFDFWNYTTGPGWVRKATLDNAGNLGLGVTPSAWDSTYRILQIGGNPVIAGGQAPLIAGNAYYNGGWKYINAGPNNAAYYQVNQANGGIHAWYTAASGTAGNAISFTQAMTLDASGNLGVGTSSPTSASGYKFLTISDAGGANGAVFESISTGVTSRFFSRSSDGTSNIGTFSNHPLTFTTNSSERARIDSSGNLLVGDTTSGTVRLRVTNSASDDIAVFKSSNATPYGVNSVFSAASPNNTTSYFYNAVDSGPTTRFKVYSNGGIANYSANNVNLSDQRVKTDIQDAGGYLAKICAIPVRTFKYKDQTDNLLNLGVIAQEVEAVAPELVDTTGFGEMPEDGVPLKAIYQTDLQYALMKALQELKAEFDAYKASHP